MANLKRKMKRKNKAKKIKPHWSTHVTDGTQLKFYCSMIVKNEEKHIKRCIDSFNGLFDKVVVLDTGSTDKTVEILESYPFVTVIKQQPFELDELFVDTKFGKKINFSKARNRCLEHCEGADWIFSIDADEEIIWTATTPAELRRKFVMLKPEVNALNIDLHDMHAGKVRMIMPTCKFYRYKRAHYERFVHNKLKVQGKAGHYTDIIVRHYGYDYAASPEEKKKKFKRTVGLLLEAIEQNPKDHESYFYLSQQYMLNDDDEKGLEYAEKYWDMRNLARRDKNFNLTVFFSAAKACMRARDWNAVMDWVTRGQKYNKADMDLKFCELQYYTDNPNGQKYPLIKKAAQEYLDFYNKFQSTPTSGKGKFHFTFTEEHVVYAQFNLCMAMMNEAVENYGKFCNASKRVQGHVQFGYWDRLVRSLQPIGLENLVKNMPFDRLDYIPS